jgi:TP901 family phage tail tape measure protein
LAIADTARLIASLELQDKFSRPAAGITRSLGGMERGFSQIGRGAGQVAGGLDRLGTRAALVAAGGLTAVVTTAASFEQAFTGVEKTVDGTAAQLAELEGVFRQMARTIPVSFEELSAIGEAGGALGIARESLDEFVDVVARLSVSTNLSSDQAATALGQLGNVLHLTGADFEDFADSLVALGNAGASTEDQIVEMAARFGAAGNSAGLTKEEILALSSAVASMGIEVEAGGSSLSRIFSGVATNIGTSSDKAVAFADTLGLSAKEFRRAWERDALGTFQDFLGELNKLDQFAQAAVLKDIGITGVRDINAVRLMAQNVGFVADQLDVARNATGALDKESQKFFDTTQGRWKVTINNVKDVANTIGAELLPIVNDLTKEFVDFLQLDSTQSGIKTFAADLASGIKGLVTELKGTDFSGIIDGMKLAASVAKGAFDAFRSLPQPIQQLAIAALVANKVSGGAVGQIAGGLANIVGGVIKVAFPKLDFFGRGSPLNPMFTKEVGLGGAAGGAGGIAGALGKSGFWAGVGKVFGVAAAVTIGAEIGRGIGGLVFDPTVAPAVKFEESQFDKFVAANEGNRTELERGLASVEDGIYQIAGNTVDGLERWLIPQLGVLEQQRDTLRELLANTPPERERNLVPTNLGGTPGTPMPVKVTNPKDISDAQRGPTEGERLIAQGLGDLEAQLINNPAFKPQITQAEFLRLLRKTSEFGEKGEGTTIEQGPKTGRDPLGDAFVALVKRVPKNLLTGEVYKEVANHIIALEEVQKQLIDEGKTDAARHAQRNIDKLAALTGVVDRTRPILERTAERTSALSARMTEAREATRSGFQASNAQLGIIARKKTSFSTTVNVHNSVAVNTSLMWEKINSVRFSAGDTTDTGGSI